MLKGFKRAFFSLHGVGIKDFEPALAHPVAKDQIIRFGGLTSSSLPWPEKMQHEADSIERTLRD